VLVSIGTNDGPWRHTDDPCDGKVTLDASTEVLRAAFATYDETCARAYAEAYRSRLDRIFSTIVALRSGRPGILIALNRYNDWLGVPTSKIAVADDLARVSPMIVSAWNRVYCDVARENAFRCADLSTRFNGPDGTRPSGDLVVDDYTHPSQLGMNAITRLLVKYGYEPLWP
jgi:lysophospholipase L1-like esterase